MRLSRTGLTLGLMSLGTLALAMPSFVGSFKSTYGVKPGGALAKAGCAVCHVGSTTKLNPYGNDLKKAMASEKTKMLTGSVLKKVEGLDSDKDGAKNLAEIRGGTLPGDAKSHPAKATGKTKTRKK